MNDTAAATTEPVTNILEVDGARLTWDLRRVGDADHRPLVMVGYPMGAAGFASQARHFADRTVVTFDPRGIERSSGGASERSLVDQNVADLRAVIAAARREVGDGPVDVFASSGGAVTALALVAEHVDGIATLVAHEPPLYDLLDDREAALQAWRGVRATYESAGSGAGMAHFIAMVSHEGPFPDDWADRPAPDPAMFGMPGEDDGSRDDPLLGQGDEGVPEYRLDTDAVAAADTRVVVAAGEATGQQSTARTSAGLAERLGSEVVVFPSDHGGFLGGEYGQVGEPDAFAARLRDVLDA